MTACLGYNFEALLDIKEGGEGHKKGRRLPFWPQFYFVATGHYSTVLTATTTALRLRSLGPVTRSRCPRCCFPGSPWAQSSVPGSHGSPAPLCSGGLKWSQVVGALWLLAEVKASPLWKKSSLTEAGKTPAD